MPTAHRQRCRLSGRLVAFDPDHLGSRHHHLAGRGVAELEDRLDHPALVGGDDAALLGQVDDFAQLDLGRERPVSQAAARRDRVTKQHQHSGNRLQQHRDHLQRKSRRQRDGVRVLAAQGAWAHADHDKTDQDHGDRGTEQCPVQAEVVVEENHQEHGRGDLTRGPQQHHQVDVARPLRHHFEQCTSAGPFVAHQFLHPGDRDRADGGVGGREQPAQCDQRDRAQQLTQAGQRSKCLDLSSNRRSFSPCRSSR